MSSKSRQRKSHGGKGHRPKQDEETPEQTWIQTLSILVYRGDPVDAQSTRHTAFFIEYEDGSNVISQVTGGHGFFQHDERWHQRPSESRHWERTIPIARLVTRGGPRDLVVREILIGVPINNQERAWNCQSWIGDSLAALSHLIPQDVITTATDAMIEVLMDAPDSD